ncbi:hypothetical protein, partial [Mycobacterium sp. 1245852.3]|uniref:hypothetical protein n=1 Tax=Mycobacterium sp. 1245852.3 TaxID=1856860 RepID=UPI003513DCC6
MLPAALRHGEHPQPLLGEAVHHRLGPLEVGVRVGEFAARQDDLGRPLEHQHRRLGGLAICSA